MINEEARAMLNAMSEALTAQRNQSQDVAVRNTLMDKINEIENQLGTLAVENATIAAQAVKDASAALENLIATAQLNPFDPLIQGPFKAIAEKVVQAADAASEAFKPVEFTAAG